MGLAKNTVCSKCGWNKYWFGITLNPENPWSILFWHFQAWNHSSQINLVILILLSLYKANNCLDKIWEFSSVLLWRISGRTQLLKWGCCGLMKEVAQRTHISRLCLSCFPHSPALKLGMIFLSFPLCQVCRACRMVVPFFLGEMRFACWDHPGTSHFRRCLESQLCPILCPPCTVSVLNALQSWCGIFRQN